jgi:hypothetical protein
MLYRKQYNINTITQNILFDDDGFIVDSDEHIFDTSSLNGYSLKECFPFIDSILDVIKQLKTEEPALIFAKVQSTYEGLQGIYDYCFSRELINDNLLIRWKIIDKTTDYTAQRDEQQIRQSNIISNSR